jgi:hypothetical protein
MREIRPSGSVEGVVSNHDPYSDCSFVEFNNVPHRFACCVQTDRADRNREYSDHALQKSPRNRFCCDDSIELRTKVAK